MRTKGALLCVSSGGVTKNCYCFALTVISTRDAYERRMQWAIARYYLSTLQIELAPLIVCDLTASLLEY